MKKLFVSLSLGLATAGASTVAFADTACSAGTASSVGTGSFIATQFTPKCSANTNVQYSQATNSFAVAAASTKGKTAFKGNTAGGTVTADTATTCETSGCTAGNVTSALTNAEAMASSS